MDCNCPDSINLNQRILSFDDETYLSGVTYEDNQSLIYISEVEVRNDDDEMKDDDTLLRSDAQEISLASRDSLALKASFKPRHKKLELYNRDMLEHKLPSDVAGRRRRKGTVIAIFFTLIVIIVSVIVLCISLTRRNEESEARLENDKSVGVPEQQSITETQSPITLPSSAPTAQAQQSLAFQIISAKVDNPELLLDPNSPQGMAFEQIVSEGRTEAFRILQRFALMVIYFSTDGEKWEWNHGWEDFSEDECRWMGIAICRMQPDGSLAVANISLGECPSGDNLMSRWKP
jgi:hypothetical protein